MIEKHYLEPNGRVSLVIVTTENESQTQAFPKVYHSSSDEIKSAKTFEDDNERFKCSSKWADLAVLISKINWNRSDKSTIESLIKEQKKTVDKKQNNPKEYEFIDIDKAKERLNHSIGLLNDNERKYKELETKYLNFN